MSTPAPRRARAASLVQSLAEFSLAEFMALCLPLSGSLPYLGGACLVGFCLACSRQPDLDEVFLPPRPIEATDAPRPPTARYDFAAGSEVELRVGPRSGRARGRLQLVAGKLTIDGFDLARTRGHAIFDLKTLSIEEPIEALSAEGAPLKEDAPAGVQPAEGRSPPTGSLTERALTWLEMSDTAHPEYRYARFSLTSVGGLTALAALDGERLRGDAARLRRRVRLDASGELELHGVRFPYTAPVDVSFEWTDAAAANKNPQRIEIVTREPVILDLTTHAILPRRASGEVDAEALGELRKGLGQQLRVSARWVAVAAAGTGPDEPPH